MRLLPELVEKYMPAHHQRNLAKLASLSDTEILCLESLSSILLTVNYAFEHIPAALYSSIWTHQEALITKLNAVAKDLWVIDGIQEFLDICRSGSLATSRAALKGDLDMLIWLRRSAISLLRRHHAKDISCVDQRLLEESLSELVTALRVPDAVDAEGKLKVLYTEWCVRQALQNLFFFLVYTTWIHQKSPARFLSIAYA